MRGRGSTLTSYRDLAAAGINPLQYDPQYRMAEGRNPQRSPSAGCAGSSSKNRRGPIPDGPEDGLETRAPFRHDQHRRAFSRASRRIQLRNSLLAASAAAAA
jgi:hypothetical protein